MSRRPLAEPASIAANAPPSHVSVVRRPLGPSTKSNVAPVIPSTSASTHAVKTQNELGDLQTELRLAAQREAKLKHSLEKWEKSHASLKEKSSKLTDLQARLGELHKVHEESKARRQREIDDLTERLGKEEERRKHDLAEAKHSVASEKAKAREYQAKCTAIEAELEHLRIQGSASSDMLSQKQALIDELQAQRDSDKIIAIDAQNKTEAAHAAHEQQAATEAARSELQSELEELLLEVDQIEQQHVHNLAMVAKAVSQHIEALQFQSRAQQDAWTIKWHHNVSERISLETLADERAAQIHELVAVVKQVQDDRDAAKQLVSTLQTDLISMTAELSAERQLASLLMVQQQDQQQQRAGVGASTSFSDLSGLSIALDTDDAANSLLQAHIEDLQARNTLLQEEADDLQSRLIARSTEAKAAEEALATVRSQVATLETAVAAKERQVDSFVAQLSELEPLRQRLATALDEAAAARREAQAQTEASRSLTASLQNARLAQNAWREERDRMAALLDQAEHFESLYHELVEQSKHLVERNALAEEEKATLSALNSELLSHNNPNQKIMYMDRVRHELDHVKQENLGLRLQLERIEEENRQLGSELSSYKAVDVPLSQRPRAEVTRVMRATDHQGLLRQVSGSMEELKPVDVRRSDDEQDSLLDARSTVHGRTTPTRAAKDAAGGKKQQKQEVEETYGDGATAEALAHPPLPMDTGLSPKKRRSYGNLSVHATGEAAEDESDNEHEDDVEDDTLLPLATGAEADRLVSEDEEVATRRNRPRHTLVNSGALRLNPPAQASSNALPASIAPSAAPTTSVTATRRPSLATSSLGIKARRVSELVRASTPPLALSGDISSLETPHSHLLDAALPSPSPYGLADWTATDETSHVPGLNPHRRGGFDLIHSTPLDLQRSKLKSRYSGAQRIPLVVDASTTPKGLLPPKRNSGTRIAIQQENRTVVEDEHDSFRKGWLYEDDEDQVDLPDFSIENPHPQRSIHTNKQQKQKPKARASIKIPKPGPMARTFFR
ncbi:uncharacterized protein UTRI_02544 [Ustilago trichophora]|uniref:Uncharacterized protein n=1 Tax=Ustilago trichophora TaxID=86804 RepID=A0A5C3E721_9BASI|nr:uncharacterized protein UTRI_02544 [Ustilago trichophora]